jgi:hypothetical protein
MAVATVVESTPSTSIAVTMPLDFCDLDMLRPRSSWPTTSLCPAGAPSRGPRPQLHLPPGLAELVRAQLLTDKQTRVSSRSSEGCAVEDRNRGVSGSGL